MRETRLRSLTKAIIWRLLGIILLYIISYLLTKSVEEATAITIAFNGMRVVMYYAYERLWDRVDWGRVFDIKVSVKHEKEPRYLSKRLRAFIDLMRPFTLIGAFTAGFCLYFAISHSILKSIISGLVLALLQAGGQVLNQSEPEEVEIDRLNGKTYRPIVKGIITPEEGKVFGIFLMVLGVTLACFISFNYLIFSILIAFFAWSYSCYPIRVKKRFFLNNLWQGISRGLLPFLAVLGVNKISLGIGLPCAMWTSFAQTTKDFNDVEGDRRFGIKTLPVVLGKERALMVMDLGMRLSFVLLFSLILLGVLPKIFIIYMGLLVPSLAIPRLIYKEHKFLENNYAWGLFYITLGLFYLLYLVLSYHVILL